MSECWWMLIGWSRWRRRLRWGFYWSSADVSPWWCEDAALEMNLRLRCWSRDDAGVLIWRWCWCRCCWTGDAAEVLMWRRECTEWLKNSPAAVLIWSWRWCWCWRCWGDDGSAPEGDSPDTKTLGIDNYLADLTLAFASFAYSFAYES